jgi:uncharacterized protein YutE (UPF0331/DUF86 family)
MSIETVESVVLERLVPDLQSQGYDVFVHPSKQMVPPFLKGFAPDVIALRDDRNLVIEIKHRRAAAEKVLKDVAKRFEGQDRWEFRIVWVNPAEAQEELKLQSRETIAAHLKEISRLLDAGFVEPAMLLCWAALEAIGRRLMAKEFSRPQTPGRLIQSLAGEGYITPDEGDILRRLAETRNRFIHGDLTVEVSRLQVEAFVATLSSLISNLNTSELH